jgi:hypothetical protein
MNQESKFYIIMKKIWPFINKIVNMIVFFILDLIKSLIKESIRMIKTGGVGE